MINEKMIDLIHRGIDGTLNQREKAELERCLAENPEAENYRREMQQISGLLDNVIPVEPPQHLKTSILNAVAGRPQTIKSVRPSLFRTLFPTVEVRFAYVVTICIGAILGIFLYPSFNLNRGENLAPTDLTGSMISEEMVKTWNVADESTIATPMVNGSEIVHYSDGLVVVTIELRSTERLNLKMSFPGDQMSLASFSRRTSTDFSLSSSSNELHVQHTGANSYTFSFRKASHSHPNVKIFLQDGENSVWQKFISIAD